MERYLEEFLAANGIRYALHTHPAVFTVAEAEEHCKDIPGLSCKNLFVKDDRGAYYLIVMPAASRLDMKMFRDAIGAQKVHFASADELLSVLKLTPGSVSPFGLVNDAGKRCAVYVDRAVWGAPIVSFHPNINTETLELKQEEFRKLFTALQHAPHLYDPAKN